MNKDNTRLNASRKPHNFRSDLRLLVSKKAAKTKSLKAHVKKLEKLKLIGAKDREINAIKSILGKVFIRLDIEYEKEKSEILAARLRNGSPIPVSDEIIPDWLRSGPSSSMPDDGD